MAFVVFVVYKDGLERPFSSCINDVHYLPSLDHAVEVTILYSPRGGSIICFSAGFYHFLLEIAKKRTAEIEVESLKKKRFSYF